MIAIDTSALIAIIAGEPERSSFLEIINGTDRSLISAVTLLETRIVTFGRHRAAGIVRLTLLLETVDPEIVPFETAQSEAAFAALTTYGKGINPQARLNFGDCASYALAKTRDVPLLFKGNDFAATDIRAAAG